jgi:RNA polymerase-binding transcription factor DksA
MKEVKQTKAQMEKRRDEINRQLNRVNEDLQMELDRDMEEQATQVEQEEVSSAMEANLRTELNDIEEKLAAMDEE